MNPTDKTARLAGLLYFLMGVPAPFALLYIPGKLIVRTDASATARNVLEFESLFRAGMIAHFISIMGFIFLSLVLYRLLNQVNRMQATTMVVLVLVSIPISLLSIVSEMSALIVLRAPELFSAFDRPQQEALAMLLLRIRGAAVMVAQFFWGFWLIPFGLLVMRSRFLTRILGILLIINGIAYAIISLTFFVAPEYTSTVNSSLFPALLGELAMILWLLIKGAKVEPVDAPRSPEAAAA